MTIIPIITGATAAGKSALARSLAQRINGVIINADSMQIYDAAPILTAQPTAADYAEVEHQLYGILDANDGCNVGRWCCLCADATHNIQQRGKTPIIVGGTGLYITSVLYGLSAIPDIDDAVRTEVRALPAASLHTLLQQEDATIAHMLRPEDTQRLSRALEVIRSTGQSLLYWQEQSSLLPLPTARFVLFNCTLPRSTLYEKINLRYDKMLEQGGLQEAQHLHERQLKADVPLSRAVGIRELLEYFNGNLTIDDAIRNAKTSSRNYAKRQMTWSSNQYRDVQHIDMQQPLSVAVQQIISLLKRT
jgi:tRNA dimethylallyltransferase